MRHDTPSTIGQRVRAARLRARLTQRKLASLAGIPAETLCRVEGDAREPELSTVRALAAALGVSAGYLVDPVDVKRVWSTE